MPSDRLLATAEALWRAASNDSIEGSADFPEPILMLVEALNGPRGAFSFMELSYTLHANGKTTVRITDDGSGMALENNGRLLTWASDSAAIGHSVYGNGLKKFLAKHGGYDMRWSIMTRVASLPTVIFKYSGPWNGADTKMDVLPATSFLDFPPTGFRITLECDTAKLFKPGDTPSASLLFDRIKELITTRKDQTVLDAVDYRLRIVDERNEEPLEITQSSRAAGWCSFEETLERMAAPVESADFQGVTKILERTDPLVEGKSTLKKKVFCVGLDMIPGFPVYGTRTGDRLLRDHIFLGNTLIEAVHPRDILGTGRLMNPHFVIFDKCSANDSTDPAHLAALPTPATTKVSFRRECTVYQTVEAHLRESRKAIVKSMTPLSVSYLEARIAGASLERAAMTAAAAPSVTPGGAPRPSSPQAPEWTPLAIEEFSEKKLEKLGAAELKKLCEHYGLPKGSSKNMVHYLMSLTQDEDGVRLLADDALTADPVKRKALLYAAAVADIE